MPDDDDDHVTPESGQPLTVAADGRPTLIRLNVAWKPLELRQVEVVGGLPIDGVSPPHLVWDPAAKRATREEPALLLHGKPLVLRVTLAHGKPPASAARLVCALVTKRFSHTLVKDIDPARLGGPLEETLETPGPFTAEIGVHELQLAFSLEVDGKRTPITADPVPLRVYTVHRPPVKNTPYASSEPHVGKVHLEHACRWADHATENIGQGKRSIPHRVNNEMRHYVHPSEWTSPKQHYASPHAPGDPVPANYADLKGQVRRGERAVSSLYYPPLEVKKPYEPYQLYEDNFGWMLLDNKTHVGGRCNQQASLFCEIVGVLGIKASVYYLQRVGFGRRTGRPARQFFNCYANGQFWNFHGIAKVQLADGSFHMYDGSFSSPPDRKNGDEAWAIGEKGPFIYSWSPFWQYEDTDEDVPRDDWPTTWDGVP